MLVGLPEPNPSDEGRPLFNSAVLLRGGRVEQRFRKALLPTYDVFDEDRYFEPFHGAQILEIAGRKLGISICEDVWNDRDFWKRRRYHHDPVEELVSADATRDRQPVGVALHRGQAREARRDARRHGAPSRRAARLRESVSAGTTTWCSTAGAAPSTPTARRSPAGDPSTPTWSSATSIEASRSPRRRTLVVESEIWRALVLGTRDYARKCGFKKAVLGLSGGIDSALTAAIAAEALGTDRVLGVLMPSPFSSRGSIDDSLRSWPETSASTR